MYVLEKGYKGFFERYPGLCQGTYKAQAGDKQEKARERSMQHNRRNYSTQDQALTLAKSASHGLRADIPRPLTNKRGPDFATALAASSNPVAAPRRANQEYVIKRIP